MLNKPENLTWKIETRSVDAISPYDKNPRIIKGKKFDDLVSSIEKFGLSQPIVINEDGTIIGGHARFLAVKQLGHESVMIAFPSRLLTEKELQELNIKFNRPTGEWDFEGLANWFDIEDLKAWGFEDFEFANFDFGGEDEQGKLDKTDLVDKTVTCPECGHTWEHQKKTKDSK